MDTMDFFDVIGNMLATGPFTPADIVLGLGAWATVGGLLLAMASAITPIPVPRKKERLSSSLQGAGQKKAA